MLKNVCAGTAVAVGAVGVGAVGVGAGAVVLGLVVVVGARTCTLPCCSALQGRKYLWRGSVFVIQSVKRCQHSSS